MITLDAPRRSGWPKVLRLYESLVCICVTLPGWSGWWDSNPQGELAPTDFKSVAWANSATSG